MNRYSSPIPSSIHDEDVEEDNRSELDPSCNEWSEEDVDKESDPSGAEWSGPENQLGLQSDDQPVRLHERGEIKLHETIAIY
jgi:hypothetical protein